MTAYYNEHDPYAAQWLRDLIAAGHIAPGDVDERSIADVRPDELSRYTQCHFFAGIGVWSYALRRAGWADDRPVWTGSCPCQPFSAAGKGGGFDDERHLWPHFHWLISQCRPPVVLGEQVASKDGLTWLDLVQADLEGTGYAAGAVDLCAAGVGAPHIRQRLWWVGERQGGESPRQRAFGRPGKHEGLEDAARERLERVGQHRHNDPGAGRLVPAGRSEPSWLDDHDDARLEGQRGGHRSALGHGQGSVRSASEAGQSGGLGYAKRIGAGRNAGAGAGPQGGPELRPERHDAGSSSAVCGLADADGGDAGTEGLQRGGEQRQQPEDGRVVRVGHANSFGERTVGRISIGAGAVGEGDVLRQADLRPGPTNGLWRDADWLFCRDGKWRPVEPGTFPLAHGAPARVGRLRAYGNAIVAQAAEEFIGAYLDAERDRHLRVTVSEMATDEGIFA